MIGGVGMNRPIVPALALTLTVNATATSNDSGKTTLRPLRRLPGFRAM